MTPGLYQDGVFIQHLADPLQAYRDCLETHKHITGLLTEATQSNRMWNLTEERKRLASIAWAIKRQWDL